MISDGRASAGYGQADGSVGLTLAGGEHGGCGTEGGCCSFVCTDVYGAPLYAGLPGEVVGVGGREEGIAAGVDEGRAGLEAVVTRVRSDEHGINTDEKPRATGDVLTLCGTVERI